MDSRFCFSAILKRTFNISYCDLIYQKIMKWDVNIAVENLTGKLAMIKWQVPAMLIANQIWWFQAWMVQTLFYQCRLYSFQALSLSTTSQYSISAPFLSTMSQYSVSALRLNTQSQYSVSALRLNTQSQHSVSALSLSTQSQHSVSALSLSTQSLSQHSISALSLSFESFQTERNAVIYIKWKKHH